jgi:ABC-type lipoprotein release transport system permease subunit
MIGMVSNIAMLVMGIMLFLGLIVINQLIDNSIKEKTYENAMLRTLGWNQSHIVLVTIMKAAIF